MSDTPITIPGNSPSLVPNRRYWPVVTLVILGINVVVFLIMTFAGGSTQTEVLLDFGASFNPYFRRGEYWRLVMPMFLHIGWLHLIVNSYALFILGPILERVYGYGRFALLYVAAGIGSSALSMSLSRNIAAGASGAIFESPAPCWWWATCTATQSRLIGDAHSAEEFFLSFCST